LLGIERSGNPAWYGDDYGLLYIVNNFMFRFVQRTQMILIMKHAYFSYSITSFLSQSPADMLPRDIVDLVDIVWSDLRCCQIN